MRTCARRCALLLLTAAAACGGLDLTSSPSLDSARLQPGSSFTVILGIQPPQFIVSPPAVVTTGPSSAATLLTICGVTPAFVTSMAPVPPTFAPELAGSLGGVLLYSEQPIPPGTRLALTHLCGGGGFGTYLATVLQGPA